ncbi:DUF6906 family protein [Desulfosporosinus sp. SB140]|uniref:DUF6906 family protein n=1 Tax=Desulfosporosinus paludis TaxID=3115649 RepID=UPI003890C30E
MKHGLKPTAKQRKRITAFGLNPDDYLVTKDTPTFFQIVHRETDEVKSWSRREKF